MIDAGIADIEFIAVNTDKQALAKSKATQKLHIGEKLTKGQGAGAVPEMGKRAAEDSMDEIATHLKGADMVFITAGMGGGTGTGGAPVIAKMAKELGILTVGIVTKPFGFEGARRMKVAEEGIAELRKCVDSLIVIPNERLRYTIQQKITLLNAFYIADDVLRQGIQSISELINYTGLINLDFADVTSVMKNAGNAHMGVGMATGKDKAEEAAQKAVESPLLETSIKGAKGLIVNITASSDVSLEDIYLASELIQREAHPEATIIWGARVDDEMEDTMKVTVIATSFEGEPRDIVFTGPEILTERQTAKAEAKTEQKADSRPAPVRPVAEDNGIPSYLGPFVDDINKELEGFSEQEPSRSRTASAPANDNRQNNSKRRDSGYSSIIDMFNGRK